MLYYVTQHSFTANISCYVFVVLMLLVIVIIRINKFVSLFTCSIAIQNVHVTVISDTIMIVWLVTVSILILHVYNALIINICIIVSSEPLLKLCSVLKYE